MPINKDLLKEYQKINLELNNNNFVEQIFNYIQLKNNTEVISEIKFLYNTAIYS